MTGRQPVDTRAACPVKDGEHRCLLARAHPRRDPIHAGSWRPAWRACHASPGALICCGLPARHQDCRPAVCINMWITCAKRHQACARAVEMLGIPPPGPAGKRSSNWEDATRALCMKRNPELSTRHAAKPVNRPNFDRMFIRL